MVYRGTGASNGKRGTSSSGDYDDDLHDNQPYDTYPPKREPSLREKYKTSVHNAQNPSYRGLIGNDFEEELVRQDRERQELEERKWANQLRKWINSIFSRN